MSTAAPCWLGKSTRHLRLGLEWALLFGAVWSPLLMAQATDAAAVASQRNAHAALDSMIQALGGPAWVRLRTSREHVRIGSFYQGNPTGEVADAVISREDPDKERVELDKGRVVQIFFRVEWLGDHLQGKEKFAGGKSGRPHALAETFPAKGAGSVDR